MLILALDTTTRAGSAALVRDGTVLVEQSGDPSLTHGQRLPADLMHILERAGARLADVDLLAVAAGPGSFTGLRVGIATMQGLALAGERRIVPVSSLDALARAGGNGVDRVAAWMDAQRGEVFGALYAADGSPEIDPSSDGPEATLERWRSAIGADRIRFIGDGALRYRDVIDRHGFASTIVVPVPMLAGIIGAIAGEAPERAVAPHAVAPIYIRRPDAEIARAARGPAPQSD